MSEPEQDSGVANPFDPFGQWKALRDSGMEAWSKLMVDFVNSDAYARASAQWLDTYLTMSQSFQQALDQAMSQTLSQYNLASTDDFIRLSERLTQIELRLDDLDARLDEMLRLLRGVAQTAAPGQEPEKPQQATTGKRTRRTAPPKRAAGGS